MLDMLGGILFFIVFGAYIYFGDKAIYYIKYHILNTRAEIYGNTGDYIMGRIIWALLLGWAAIPLALIHNNFLRRS